MGTVLIRGHRGGSCADYAQKHTQTRVSERAQTHKGAAYESGAAAKLAARVKLLRWRVSDIMRLRGNEFPKRQQELAPPFLFFFFFSFFPFLDFFFLLSAAQRTACRLALSRWKLINRQLANGEWRDCESEGDRGRPDRQLRKDGVLWAAVCF